MEDKEKAIEQLSGRVTETQKAYFNEMEGSFADKVAELIESHKVRVKDNAFNVEANKSAIHQALNVIVKNMETIELNAKNYVQSVNDDIGNRIEELEGNADELSNALSENQELKKTNQDISSEMKKLISDYEELMNKSTSEQANAAVKYDKLKKEYEELNQSYMKLRIQFGDMKDDLTRKNISLTDMLNKLNEEHNREVSKLKEDHAAELAKLNKESQEKIDRISVDYSRLKIKSDETISKLDKELAVANSVIESKIDLVKRLEEKMSSDNRHLENVIGPMAVYYSRRNRELESILEQNDIAYPENNFQNGGREDIIDQRKKNKSVKKEDK